WINTSVPILQLFFNEGDLKPAFRLNRATLVLLLQMLPLQKVHGWPQEIEVLVTLYWLACGASYRATADIFGMPLSTVCRVVHRVVNSLMGIIPKIIFLPKPQDLEVVGAGFARLAGIEAFRAAVGANDGCHVRIVPPAEPQKRCYMNRKLFPSIILQGVCDARGKFMDVYIGNVSSVHEALVLRRSPLYKNALYPPEGFFLLGDGGILPKLKVNFIFGTSQVEARYNRHHAKARNIVERAFGSLKTTWWRSIFFKLLEVRPTFAPKVIAACCTLHNICLEAGDQVDVEQEVNPEADGHPAAEDREMSGSCLQARLAVQISCPAELPEILSEHD
uniref:DDE Tnp4 domain-containing protein n=1 Tax=Fundulus heteroclitus TaxID=8078 RepID=A0A3Q2QYN6_FUNHE